MSKHHHLEVPGRGTADPDRMGRWVTIIDPYRYVLGRRWAQDGPTILWVMLNPSVADAHRDDATLRRIIRFSADWGFSGLEVVNLFALISASPKMLTQFFDPVGPQCDQYIEAAANRAATTVIAWGASIPSGWRGRPDVVLKLLRRRGCKIQCLGRTDAGHPRHPLRLAADTPREPWT